LNTLFIGQNIIELAETESTNSYASGLLKVHPPDGTVVLAHSQKAGRGQQGNEWHSEPGKNLTLSLILYPAPLAATQIFLLNKLFSCALYDFLIEWLPDADVQIKWPNDLLVNRRKIAGMLLENQLSGSRINSTVAGFGINVNQTKFPEKDYRQATSMAQVAGHEFDLNEVLEDLLARIEARWLAMRAGRRDQIERDYLQNLFGYQEKIELEIGGEIELRYLAGVDPHGRLALQKGQKLEYYNIKEVRFCM
jgi:BirA family biotin operon repressor/biotin-[acetyl-CoA-carboxylase] ligase